VGGFPANWTRVDLRAIPAAGAPVASSCAVTARDDRRYGIGSQLVETEQREELAVELGLGFGGPRVGPVCPQHQLD